jgi:hypothetical protein
MCCTVVVAVSVRSGAFRVITPELDETLEIPVYRLCFPVTVLITALLLTIGRAADCERRADPAVGSGGQ